eukprot:UN19640
MFDKCMFDPSFRYHILFITLQIGILCSSIQEKQIQMLERNHSS